MRLGSNLNQDMPAFSTARLQTRVVERWNKAIAPQEQRLRIAMGDLLLSFDEPSKPLCYYGLDGAFAGYIAEGWTRIVDRPVTIQWMRTALSGHPFAGIHSLLDLAEQPVMAFPWETREAMTLLAIATYNAILRCTVLPIQGTHFSPTIAGCVALCIRLEIPLEL